MSEEDTFKRLRRTPFRPLFIKILDPIKLGGDIVPKDRTHILEQEGWEYNEFLDVMWDEMSKGNINGSATMLSDPEWRKEFLSKEPIY